MLHAIADVLRAAGSRIAGDNFVAVRTSPHLVLLAFASSQVTTLAHMLCFDVCWGTCVFFALDCQTEVRKATLQSGTW